MTIEKKVLGRINCPSCGEVESMRVTLDKNGAPFGYCDMNCEVQLRLGGNQLRVKAFLNKHPHIKAAYEGLNPVTDTAVKSQETGKATPPKLADLQIDITEKKPKPKAAFSIGDL